MTPAGVVSTLISGGLTGPEGLAFDASGNLFVADAEANAIYEVPLAPASVTSVSAAAGPLAGGTTVTITGSGFIGATAVSFGGTAATSFTVVSDTQITAVDPAGTGTVDVTVTTPYGTSATSAADQFTYMQAPTISGVTPGEGPMAGGTRVAITGSNLGTASTAAVEFGTAAATIVSDNGTQIIAISPSEVGIGPGGIHVTVTTAGGTSAASTGDYFVYLLTPAVSSITPASGPVAGGTTVTINGSSLWTDDTTVDFGTTPANIVSWSSDGTQLVVTSPASAGASVVDVTVTTPGGASATSTADQFTYVVAPTVSGIAPSTGLPGGGTIVTISGANFTGATAVEFMGMQATSFTVNSDTQITAVAPGIMLPGYLVDVTVTTPGGMSAFSTADQFLYMPVTPTINWPDPADITYGTALSSTQLDATASAVVNGQTVNVPGTFVYTPEAGTMLSAGDGQTPSVSFTPDDMMDYFAATGTTEINVDPATSSFSSLNAPTITYGDASDTISGQISSNAANDAVPTGNVAITLDGVTQNATIQANGGFSSVFTTSGLNAAAYTVSCNYAATTDFTAVSGTVGLTVNKADATITVTPYAVTYDGNPHTATGTAVGAKGESLGGLDLSGTTHTGAGAYGSNAWTFTDSTGNYNNASGTVSDSIAKAASLTTLSDSANPSGFGQPVTFTATVSPTPPSTGTSAESVTFEDNGAPLPGNSMVALVNGTASFTTSALAMGNHTITAVYSGDSNYTTSSSLPDSHKVEQASKATMTTSLKTSTFGQKVTLKATIAAAAKGAGKPTGTVTFEDNGVALPGNSTVTLSAGKATFTIWTLPAGSHSITAVYNGDTTFAPSTSPDPLAKATPSQLTRTCQPTSS